MLQITTLIENTAGEHHGLKNEHGISFYIEKDGRKILFDTGQSDGFLYNAARLNIDLSSLDFVVLSHGHYDHSGGFRTLCGKSRKFSLRMGEGFFVPKYAFRNGAYDFLGNDFNESYLVERGVEYSTVFREVEEIFPGAFLLTRFPRIHPEEKINPRFFLMKDGCFEQDLFNDEILLAIETGEGLAVLLGCSHPGMMNMLDAVKQRLGRSLRVVLGGSHLVEARGGGLEKSLRYLRSSEITSVGVSHCTGIDVVNRLRSVCPNFFHNITGSSLFFE